MNSTVMNQKVHFPGVKDGDAFRIGDMEFIKFPDKDGMTPVVMRDVAFYSSYGENNNLKESGILKRMQDEILPKIIEAVGAENVCTFKTDLTTLDGLKPYGELESQISLPTHDFYRENVVIFDRHKVDDWWWLATPDSAQPHDVPHWILCVSPSGFILTDFGNQVSGVRPILFFESNIFGSSEA